VSGFNVRAVGAVGLWLVVVLGAVLAVAIWWTVERIVTSIHEHRRIKRLRQQLNSIEESMQEERQPAAADQPLPHRTNRTDLGCIKGIGNQYSDLLAAAGVNTVAELAQRSPDSLQAAIVEVNAEKELVRRPPSRDMVADWITQARGLPPIIYN
jgi:predicted flap endonuclease-1-like 5' DNA nuclease